MPLYKLEGTLTTQFQGQFAAVAMHTIVRWWQQASAPHESSIVGRSNSDWSLKINIDGEITFNIRKHLIGNLNGMSTDIC
jgi:hypothetical protein